MNVGLDTPLRETEAPRNGAAPAPAPPPPAPALRPPRVVLTLLVSDEVELVGPLLDYYFEQGVDYAIVTANRAPDAVLETVDAYVERGRARLIREDSGDFEQSRWVTAMAREAATEQGAEWVLNVDADEFFWPEGGTLKEVLAAVPPDYGALDVPVCHFVPSQDEHGFFADRLTVRETRSLKPSHRAVFAKAVHRAAPDVEVSMGNHRVAGTEVRVLKGWQPICGLHFPLRGWEQFEARVARDLRADPSLGMGRYRERWELLCDGRLREAYEREVMSEEEIARGLDEGVLVRDERLKRFFEGAQADEESFDPGRVAELRLGALRAAREYESHPFAFEVAKLRRQLDKARSGREKFRRRQATLERRRDEAKRKLRAVRSTPPFRLGRRLEALRAGIRPRRDL